MNRCSENKQININMKNALITSLFLACPWAALSDEGADVFAHLETKIEAQLKKGNFHPTSQAAVRAQWACHPSSLWPT